MLDLSAPIVPGNSAAGFQLGQGLDDVASTLSGVIEWNPGFGSLEGFIRDQPIDVWVKVDRKSSVVPSRSTSFHLGGGGAVILQFDGSGVLDSIRVSNGYQGAVWGDVAIGSMVSAAAVHIDLDFDGGEEQFYPSDEKHPNVEFYTDDDGDRSVPISTISVNRYSPK